MASSPRARPGKGKSAKAKAFDAVRKAEEDAQQFKRTARKAGKSKASCGGIAGGTRRLAIDAAVIVMAVLSLHHLDVRLFRGGQKSPTSVPGGEVIDVIDGASSCSVPRSHLHPDPLVPPLSPEAATTYLTKAGTFKGERGEGKLGWLHLLAAHDISNGMDADILWNVVENYAAWNPGLAIEQLVLLQNPLRALGSSADPASGRGNMLQGNAALRVHDHLEDLRRRFPAQYAAYKESAATDDRSASGLPGIPQPRWELPFATAVGLWDPKDLERDALKAAAAGAAGATGAGGAESLREMNEVFYRKTLEEFQRMKARMGAKQAAGLTDTEANHAFFKYQMAAVDPKDGSGGVFKELPLFKYLSVAMREAAALFLERHGMDRATARSKAFSHNFLLWASVHTGDSIHEPHNTDDSLIGGVYYVTVPQHSGELALFDPRGKSPVKGGGADELPAPPFHRTVGIRPREGLMVLFPGWLVHQVLPSTGLDVKKQRYRISISLNLKGEWQDTAALMVADRKSHGRCSGGRMNKERTRRGLMGQ